jgi:hypothetical protein
MGVDGLAPDTDREPVTRLLAPRHLRDGHPPVRRAEHGPAEQQEQRNVAAVQAGEVPRGADLHVVGQRHRQIDLATSGESRNHDRDVRELHRLERVGPALGVAEQVVQPLGFLVGVPPPRRLDPELTAQRDRLDSLAAGLADPQREEHRWHDRVSVGACADTVEDQFRHDRPPG